MIKELEKDIQNTICEYLARKKHFFWRQNTAPTIQKSGDQWAFRRMPKYAMKGVPDILIVTDGGYMVFLEVKRKGSKQSPDQIVFQERCKEKGCEYYVVHSLEEVIEIGL